MKIHENVLHAGIARNTAVWQSDFTADFADDGTISANHSFQCVSYDARALIPKHGSPCQHRGYETLRLSSARVTEDDGLIATVDCSYGGTTGDGDFSFDPGTGTGTFDGKVKTSLSLATAEEPLATNPRYQPDPPTGASYPPKGTAPVRTAILKEFNDGNIVLVFDEDDNSDGWFRLDAEGQPTIGVELEGGEDELFRNLTMSYDSFLDPTMEWSVSVRQNNAITSAQLNSLGTIVRPPYNPPTPRNRDWLFSSATQDEQSGFFDVTFSFRLSGRGGWDPRIYKHTNV